MRRGTKGLRVGSMPRSRSSRRSRSSARRLRPRTPSGAVSSSAQRRDTSPSRIDPRHRALTCLDPLALSSFVIHPRCFPRFRAQNRTQASYARFIPRVLSVRPSSLCPDLLQSPLPRLFPYDLTTPPIPHPPPPSLKRRTRTDSRLQTPIIIGSHPLCISHTHPRISIHPSIHPS